jgi:hypothetical protein
VGQSVPVTAAQRDEKSQLRRNLADTGTKLKTILARQEDIQRASDRLQRSRLVAAEHREGFLKIRQKAERIEADLNSWQQNIAPIRRLLTLESSNRGLHFTAVGDVEAAGKPAFPTMWIVLAASLGIAVACGALTVLVVELLDHSYRSAKQLASLGVPVIRMIDEIVTRETHKSRVLRRLVVIPSMVIILLAVLLSAGSLAIRSLDAGFRGPRQEIAATRAPSTIELTDSSKASVDAAYEQVETGD